MTDEYVVFIRIDSQLDTDIIQGATEARQWVADRMEACGECSWTGGYRGSLLRYDGRTAAGELVAIGMYQWGGGSVDLPVSEQTAVTPEEYDRLSGYGVGA